MARKSLVAEVSDDVLDRIVRGELEADDLVPGELELGAALDVSRMTVREAIRTLAAQNIVRVERGRGTFVNPINRWNSLDAVLRATSEGRDAFSAAIQLIELRRMLETGACELAARKITAEELDRLRGELAEMREAHEVGDVDRFVAADLAFHDVVLHASGNAFVAVLFEPLQRVLAERRTETSAFEEIQRHAVAEHESVLGALESGDPARARSAMDSHMQQTLDDVKTYVFADADHTDGVTE